MYIYKMNVKLDMNTLNCVLLVVVLSLVIMCCMKTNNESFQSIGAPLCSEHGSKKPCIDQSWCGWLSKTDECVNKLDLMKRNRSEGWEERSYVPFGKKTAWMDLKECEKYNTLPQGWNIRRQCNLDPSCKYSSNRGCDYDINSVQRPAFLNCEEMGKDRTECIKGQGVGLGCKWSSGRGCSTPGGIKYNNCEEIDDDRRECRNGQGRDLGCNWASSKQKCYTPQPGIQYKNCEEIGRNRRECIKGQGSELGPDACKWSSNQKRCYTPKVSGVGDLSSPPPDF